MLLPIILTMQETINEIILSHAKKIARATVVLDCSIKNWQTKSTTNDERINNAALTAADLPPHITKQLPKINANNGPLRLELAKTFFRQEATAITEQIAKATEKRDKLLADTYETIWTNVISTNIIGIDDDDIEETRVHWMTAFEGKLIIAKVPIALEFEIQRLKHTQAQEVKKAKFLAKKNLEDEHVQLSRKDYDKLIATTKTAKKTTPRNPATKKKAPKQSATKKTQPKPPSPNANAKKNFRRGRKNGNQGRANQ
jgi:hypothetical protein